MNDIEREAQKVNCSASVDGVYTWMCEGCGITWTEEASRYDFVNFRGEFRDRTMDYTNWPVLCLRCMSPGCVS